MGKHNYPKTRKPRNTDYAQSTKLIKAVGLDKIKEALTRHGIYLAADELAVEFHAPVSAYVVRYIRNKYNLRGDKNGEIL